jgi:hypothetical protein
MKRSTLVRLALVAAGGAALAGCGGGGGSSFSTTTATAPQPTLQQTFGIQFAVDFAAPANSQPVVPASGDIIPLSLTTQPTALH